MHQSYTPSDSLLEKYATLIVQFGLRSAEGKKLPKGSVILLNVPEVAKPLAFHLHSATLKQGYNAILNFTPSNEGKYQFNKSYYELAKKEQLLHSNTTYTKGLIDQIDGSIHIIAETDPHALADIQAKKILAKSLAGKKGIQHRKQKIDAGKLMWTIALYGTGAMADEAGMSLKQYWNQIIKACYLKSPTPVKEWERINRTVQKTAQKLTKLEIQSVHMTGADCDITLGIGSDRKWLAGGGNNIPSFEVFTSPQWQQVNGWIRLNQPHYRYGKKIEGIQLWFKDGVVYKSAATKHHDLLKAMLNTPGGNKLGEFSLTDARLSKITKFMAEILYDENTGGKYGNTHVALGSAFRDCYNKKTDPNWKKSDWEKLGFNSSVVHSDVISTTDRTVTATLADGKTKVIYEKGQFTI
jgi:aminopeptidase